MKRALITGITGQDGSYLAELLLAKGYQVYGLIRRCSVPNLERISHIKERIILLQGDLLDERSLRSAVEQAQPSEIYNLAAQTFVRLSFEQPLATAEYTGMGVLRLLEAIRASGQSSRFYQASTSELYGIAYESPQNEHTRLHPRSPYGCAKLFAHHTTINYREAYGLHASCGILFNHESPRRGEEFVTQKICRGVARVARGEQQHLTLGNLHAARDWGYAPDYVRAMWLMLQQERPGDYVIATGEAHTVKDFVQLAFQYVGIRNWENYVRTDPVLYRPAEVHALKGDARKAKEQLGWEPEVCFEELVQIMMEEELGKQQIQKTDHSIIRRSKVTG